MIKTEIVKNISEEKSIYPCLKRSTRNDIIVLFSEKNTGTIVHIGPNEKVFSTVGIHETTWGEEVFFIPFNGEVALRNG